MKRKDVNEYPKGWTAAQIRNLARFHDKQAENEEPAEIRVALKHNANEAVIIVPKKLIPAIKQLIAKNKKRVG